MISLRATSQQDRAKWAWEAVARASASDDTYLREAKKLPARLLTSGMGQTLAYLHAKQKSGGEPSGIGLLYAQLGERLRDLQVAARKLDKHEASRHSGMDIIVELDARDYRLLSRELLASAEWIKRFAEGKPGS